MTHRILLVEDDEDTRKQLRYLLKRAGCSVDEAENDVDATELLLTNRYDLALVDAGLDQPDFNWRCQAFFKKLDEEYPSLPVIATTAKNLDPREMWILATSSVDDFIYKPTTSFDEIEAHVQRLLAGNFKASRIFISYRHDDSSDIAHGLYGKLIDHFGDGQVFMDVNGITPGTAFDEEIRKALETCQVLLAIIGPKWLTLTNADGERKLLAKNDFVRVEIAVALRRKILVIPVLAHGATMPAAADLPRGLKRLPKLQAISIRPDRHYETYVKDLLKTVGDHIQKTRS
ncbi:MAG: TIR domain-containing protein [Anaerolineae bacterium]|nr:TIR domain-containing protein [Anaerolineae bacterium]MCA9910957.1 TIR domain-containing protein [Anaerolineae bacterium]